MEEHRLESFATVVVLWNLATFLIKLIRKLLKWKYIQLKNYAISAMLQKRSYLLSKKSRPGYPDWSVHMGKFSSLVTEVSVAKTEISVMARLLI